MMMLIIKGVWTFDWTELSSTAGSPAALYGIFICQTQYTGRQRASVLSVRCDRYLTDCFFFFLNFGLHWTRKWNVLPKSCCCIKISLSFVVGLIKTSDVVHYCFTVCLFNVSEIQVGCLLWRLNQRMMTKDRQLSSGSVQETKSKQLFQSRMWTLSYLDTWSALLHRWSVLMSLEGACYLWCSLLSDLTQGLWLGSTTWYFFFFFFFLSID